MGFCGIMEPIPINTRFLAVAGLEQETVVGRNCKMCVEGDLIVPTACYLHYPSR